MSIEALLLAKRNNYNILVPCNVVDTQNPKIANLLFIFYMSKVRFRVRTSIRVRVRTSIRS